jgi:YVTN family beta-propeller protein
VLKGLGEEYADVSAEHRRLLRNAFAAHGGLEIDTQGDSLFWVFRRARDAAAAAADGQRALAEHPWPNIASLRVRMGLHSGEPQVGPEGLVGLSVVRGARIMAVAHGGQVLVSETTRSLLQDELPPELGLRDLGAHRLKDFDEPQRLYQLTATGLAASFAPPRTRRKPRRRLVAALLAAGVAAVVGAVLLLALAGGEAAAVTLRPNTLAAIDPETNRVVAQVPVGAEPVGVAFHDGAAWAVSSADATVTRVDASTLETRSITLGRPDDVHPIAIAAGGGGVWVAYGAERSVQQLDARYLGRLRGDPVRIVGEPVGLAVGGGAVWAPTIATVERVDSGTRARTGSIVLDSGASSVAFGEGALWVGGIFGLTAIDPATEVARPAIPIPGLEVTSISVAGGEVWAGYRSGAGYASNGVAKVPVQATTATATIELAAAPVAVAAEEDSVWVATAADGMLSRVDADADTVAATIPLGATPSGLATGGGRVWVVVR